MKRDPLHHYHQLVLLESAWLFCPLDQVLCFLEQTYIHTRKFNYWISYPLACEQASPFNYPFLFPPLALPSPFVCCSRLTSCDSPLQMESLLTGYVPSKSHCIKYSTTKSTNGKISCLESNKDRRKRMCEIVAYPSMSIPVFSLRLFPTYVPIFHML